MLFFATSSSSSSPLVGRPATSAAEPSAGALAGDGGAIGEGVAGATGAGVGGVAGAARLAAFRRHAVERPAGQLRRRRSRAAVAGAAGGGVARAAGSFADRLEHEDGCWGDFPFGR